MTYIPTDAERKQCCLNCIYFKVCKLVAEWNVEYGEDGFYPNCTKCGDFTGNWLRKAVAVPMTARKGE